MSITSKDLENLLQKSGNRCAFPGCEELLLHTDPDHVGEKVILSNIAHIVAQSEDDPFDRHRVNSGSDEAISPFPDTFYGRGDCFATRFRSGSQ